MSLVDRIARGVKAMLGARVLNLASNGVLIVLLTRVLLDPEQFGQLNFVLSALGVVTILATLGLPKSAARYVTEFSETDPGQVPHVVRKSLTFILALVVVVAGGTLLLGRPVANALGTPSLVPFLLAGSLFVAARALTKYFSALFQGFNRVTYSATVSAVTSVSRLPLVAGFVVLGFGVGGALYGYVASFALAAGVGGYLAYTRFYTGYEAADAPADDLSKRLLEYSVPLTATRGANVLDKKVDTLLVGVLLNMTAVGYYTIAKQVSDFVSAPASSFGYTVSPALGEQSSKDQTERAAKLYEQSLQYVLLAYVPAVVGLILVADPMVRYVFGSDYLGAVPVLQVFSGFMLVNAVNKVTSDGLDYLGRARSRAVIKSAMAVSNAGLNLLLIPVLGVVGAAVATVITYTVYTLSNVYFIHQELTIRFGFVLRRLAVTCLVTVAMAAAVWLALPYVTGLLTLFGAVFLGFGTWAALSVAGGILDVKRVAKLLT
ncbi:flippase [Halobacterium bonnevillei]|uniref:Oligosaccharide flippase family protein n=1 Tax=Halobacterium bonnevillei TaxID=2692200 RepID=A0A6B0SDW9_9EURY|nr:flippase [Halobacterium bonnevillei]MXR19618.1 oligosaccharide flippase family protein [Halobacterium bonnevillei]